MSTIEITITPRQDVRFIGNKIVITEKAAKKATPAYDFSLDDIVMAEPKKRANKAAAVR